MPMNAWCSREGSWKVGTKTSEGKNYKLVPTVNSDSQSEFTAAFDFDWCVHHTGPWNAMQASRPELRRDLRGSGGGALQGCAMRKLHHGN